MFFLRFKRKTLLFFDLFTIIFVKEQFCRLGSFLIGHFSGRIDDEINLLALSQIKQPPARVGIHILHIDQIDRTIQTRVPKSVFVAFGNPSVVSLEPHCARNVDFINSGLNAVVTTIRMQRILAVLVNVASPHIKVVGEDNLSNGQRRPVGVSYLPGYTDVSVATDA